MSVAECQPLTRAEVRRQKIRQVARSLFIEHGFHRTGIALIAKASGVAVQQLYRDFPAKEDIIAAIVEEDCGRFADLAALDLALAQEDRSAIRNWLIAAVCRKNVEDARLFLEIAAEATRNARINAIFSNIRASIAEHIGRAFAGLDGLHVVQDCHRASAEAYLIASFGSTCTRGLHDGDIQRPSTTLVSCLIDGNTRHPLQRPGDACGIGSFAT